MYACCPKKKTRFVIAAGEAEETSNEFDAEALGD